MKQRYLALGLAGSLILGSVPVRAADASGATGAAGASGATGVTGIELPAGTSWQPTQGHNPVSNFSNADQIIFNQQATQGRLEQLCRNISLAGNINQSFAGGDVSISLGVLRRLVTLPSVEHPQDLELYQVDEYSPGIGFAPTIELASRADESIGLGIGASFDLDSTVVRPRQFSKNCEEIKALLDVKDVKVVFPPSILKNPTKLNKEEFVKIMAPRIAGMEDGELWSLSGVTTLSAAPSFAATTGHISAGVSIGATQKGQATMIVHRLSPTHTRFSLRVSHLHVFNASGVVADVPIINIFNPGGAITVTNLLEKVFNSAIANQLVSYFTASFTALQQIGGQSTQGYLIAFDLDTSDPAQVAELAEMMQSDFLTLLQKNVAMATFRANEKENLEHFQRLTEKHGQVFDRAASIVQTDVGRIDANHSVTLKLPILGAHTRGSDATRDDVVTVGPNFANGDGSRQLHLSSAERPMNDQGLSIPIINKTVVSNNSDSKFSSFYFGDDGKVQVVFTHLDAFQRRTAGAVQATLDEYRDILSMAGSRGVPAADVDPSKYQVSVPESHGHAYKDGSLAFSLNITAAGVDKAFRASYAEIERSAERVFPIYNNNNENDNNRSEPTAQRLAEIIVGARDATPEQRNAVIRALVADHGNSNVVEDSLRSAFSFLPLTSIRDLITSSGSPNITYEEILKVFVQLADPADVSANLTLKINKGVKGEKPATANISVNQDDSNVDLIDAGHANRVRTVQPKYMDINQ
jgi:hypothetical protein